MDITFEIDETIAGKLDPEPVGRAISAALEQFYPDRLPDGASVEAGQPIGTHIGTQTWSDVTIRVQTPRGTALVSWFDALTESALAAYTSRGLASRAAAIISRSERDANPLGCNGETFANRGTIENWVELGR